MNLSIYTKTMKRLKRKLFLLFLILFVFTSVSLPAREEDNLNRVLEFLEQMPESVSVSLRPLLAEFGGFGSSLLVSNQIDEIEEQNGTFVFAVPLAASFAVDTALSLVERFAESEGRILVAFLGNEVNELPLDTGGVTHKGLRDLLTLTYMPENWVICYFDARSPPGGVVLSHGIRAYVTPLELLSPLPDLFSSRAIPWSFQIRHNNIFRLGLVEGPEALSIIRSSEVHGFLLSSADYDGTAILPEDLADLLLEYSELLSFPVLNPDTHYSFLTFPGGRVLFVSELMKVILMLAASALFLLSYLSYTARFSAVLMFHVKLFFRHLFPFILLFSLFVISIKFSAFLYSLFFSLFYIPARTPGYISVVFILLLSLLIFSLSPLVFNFLRFPVRKRFYRSSAVIFIIFGIFISLLLDFSHIPVFFVVFAFFFIGTFFSNPIPVFLLALSLPLFALVTLSSIFITDSERLLTLFINAGWNSFDTWLIIIYTALLSLPAFLLARRGITLSKMFLRRVIKISRKKRRKIIPAMIAAVIIVMTLQMVIPLRGIPAERRFLDTSFYSELDEILTLNINDVVFLDSRIITLNLEARGSPVRFDVSILSMDERTLLPIYSTPVPVERSLDGKRINLFLGEYPPNPLDLEIVVPLGFHGRLEFAALYNVWDPAIDPFPEPLTSDYVLRLSKNIDL